MQYRITFAWILLTGLFGLAGTLAATGRGDVVYTTATVAGTASNGNVKTPSDALSYEVGTLPSGTSGLTLNFNKSGGNTIYGMIQFTTASSSPAYKLTGINASFFFDGKHKKDLDTTLSNATATWHLYQGLTSVGTFTQNWNSMNHPAGATAGPNVYQNTSISTQYDLVAGTQYSLVLESLTGINLTADSANDSVHWTFYDQAPASTGQAFTNVSSGFFSGAYTNTIGTPQDLSFDIAATAVPEPGTLALGTMALLGGAGIWWRHRKKIPAGQPVAIAKSVG